MNERNILIRTFEKALLLLLILPGGNHLLGSCNRFSLFDTAQGRPISVFIENMQASSDDQKQRPYLFYTKLLAHKICLSPTGLTYFFTKSDQKDSTILSYARFDLELKNVLIKKENIFKEKETNEYYNFVNPSHPEGIYGRKGYQQLRIKNVYPGIDWLLYITEEQHLKYDFILRPGADPTQIKLLYRTLEPIDLKDGSIDVRSDWLEFSEQAPISFLQENKQAVKSAFQLVQQSKKEAEGFCYYETEIGFKLESYNRDQTLIIDPLQLWWTTLYGGGFDSGARALCNDSKGNLYVLGHTRSIDLPTQNYNSLAYFQGTISTSNGNYPEDMYILKFSNSGVLLWATYLGGTQADLGVDIKCDGGDDVFVLGKVESQDFPLKNPGGNAYFDNTNGAGSWHDFYIGKFSGNGVYLWGTFYGGNYTETPLSLAVEPPGNVICSGYTNSPDFPCYNAGSGAFFDNNFGTGVNETEAFIVKFLNDGQLYHATFFGGDSYEQISSSCVDPFGNFYFCGSSDSQNMFTLNQGGSSYFQGSLNGQNVGNGFILKLNSNFLPLWCTYLGSPGSHLASIVSDKNGSIYVSGTAMSGYPLVNPGNGAFFQGPACCDVVISKFTSAGQMTWSSFFGQGNSSDVALFAGNCDEIYMASMPYASSSITCSLSSAVNPGNGAFFIGPPIVNATSSFLSAFSSSCQQKWGTRYTVLGGLPLFKLSFYKNDIFFINNCYLQNFTSVSALQNFTSTTLVDPGNNAYFQTLAPVNSIFGSAYGIVGKFTGPSFTTSFSGLGCGNTNTAIAQSSGGWGPYTYTWSTGSQHDSIANVPQGTYTYTVTDHYFGCQNTNTVYLGLPSLTLTIQSSTNAICAGQSAVISVQGANNFSWSPASALNTNSGSSVVATPLSSTQFTITGYNSPTCSTDSLLQLVVHPRPVLLANYSDSVCFGNNVPLTVSGAQTYSWLPKTLFKNAFQDTVTLLATQDETIRVIGQDQNSCTDSLNLRLKVIPLPTLSVSGPTAVCSGNSATLELSGAQNFAWSPFLNTSYSDSTGLVIHSFTSPVTYSIKGNNEFVCFDSLIFKIALLPVPELAITSPDSICPDLNFELVATGKGDLVWSGPGFLECNDCNTSVAKINRDTWIYCTLTDQNLCRSSDSSFVQLKKDCSPVLLVPNIFTPNNDNANDLFKITGRNVNSFSCEIVNRWGTVMNSFNSIDGSWDGKTTDGKESADGVYMYVIRLSDVWGTIHVYKGTIQLIR